MLEAITSFFGVNKTTNFLYFISESRGDTFEAFKTCREKNYGKQIDRVHREYCQWYGLRLYLDQTGKEMSKREKEGYQVFLKKLDRLMIRVGGKIYGIDPKTVDFDPVEKVFPHLFV